MGAPADLIILGHSVNLDLKDAAASSWHACPRVILRDEEGTGSGQIEYESYIGVITAAIPGCARWMQYGRTLA